MTLAIVSREHLEKDKSEGAPFNTIKDENQWHECHLWTNKERQCLGISILLGCQMIGKLQQPAVSHCSTTGEALS